MKTKKIIHTVILLIAILINSGCKKKTEEDLNPNQRTAFGVCDLINGTVDYRLTVYSIALNSGYVSVYKTESEGGAGSTFNLNGSTVTYSYSVTERTGTISSSTTTNYSGTLNASAFIKNQQNKIEIVRDGSGWKLLVNGKNEDVAGSIGGGGGGSTYCFVGAVWKKSDCNGAVYNIQFSSNNTGYMTYTGCAPWNVTSSRYEFNWTESAGSITYTYTHCERPQGTTIANLNGGSQSYSCTSTTFTTGGDTWTH